MAYTNVESAHRQISELLIMNSGDVISTPHGLVARWVVNSTLFYLEAILNYGDWRRAGLSSPYSEVKTFSRRYGVTL